MNHIGWRLLGALFAAAAMAGLRLLSFAPYAADPGVRAVIRLAWRARGEGMKICRRLTPEELQMLPPHMRQEEICEGKPLPYRLVVAIDGVTLADRLVLGGGARHDRPLYVLQDFSVPPGSHRVSVSFTLQTPAPSERAGKEEGSTGDTTPARLTLDKTLGVGAGRVLLVTYDDALQELVVRSGTSA